MLPPLVLHPAARSPLPGDPEREGVLDGVKAAVCANINLFMETSEEEFAKFLQTFVTDVWHLLMQVGGVQQLRQQQAGMGSLCVSRCMCWRQS